MYRRHDAIAVHTCSDGGFCDGGAFIKPSSSSNHFRRRTMSRDECIYGEYRCWEMLLELSGKRRAASEMGNCVSEI